MRTSNAPRLGLALALLVVAGCASSPRTPAAPSAAAPAAPVAIPSPAAAPFRDTHEQLQATLWMQTAIEYRMVCESIYRAGAAALDDALADPTWSAAVEQTDGASDLPPAVVLDLDETVLDNSRFQGELVRRRLVYTRELWGQWARQRRAELVPGAKAFLAAAHEMGIAVFFVTNRTPEEESDTISNLAALGVDTTPEHVMCVGENGWPADKSARRQLLAGTHRIVMLVGDDLGDFVPARLPVADRAAAAEKHTDWWGTRWIVLPNPAYGSWERALLGFEPGLSEGQSLQRKLSLVKGFTE
jgi:acid phosphatase